VAAGLTLSALRVRAAGSIIPVARLLQSPLDILELTLDTDILALFNPRLSDIPPASDADGVLKK
jgi:hypothetical protein